MSEYVFRDANGFGCDMSEPMFDGNGETAGEFYARENDDHYGTLHEEIVRCKDCVCFQMKVFGDGGHQHWCFYHGSDYAEPDGFCAWGERKAEE